MADKDLGIVELNRKEHDDSLGIAGKRVFPWGFDGANAQPIATDILGRTQLGSSSATIFAVVNTAASGQASVVIDSGTKQIGSVTVSNIVNSLATVTIDNSKIVGTGNPQGLFVSTASGSPQAVTIKFPSGNSWTESNGVGLVNVQNFAVGAFGSNGTISSNLTSGLAFSQLFAYDGANAVRLNGDLSNGLDVDVTRLPSGATVVAGAGTAQIGSVTVANTLDIRSLNSTTTLFAVVNTGAVGNTNALATLLAGPNQIGSVTVSNIVNALATTTPSGTVSVAWSSGATVAVSHLPSIPVGTATIGVVTSNSNLLAGTNFIGLATVVNGAGTSQIGSVTVSNTLDIRSLNSTTTLFAVVNTSAAGQASVVIDPQPILNTSAKSALFVSTATGSMMNMALMGRGGNVANVNALSALDMSLLSAATIYAVVNTAAAGQASVVLDAGTKQIGSVTISHVVNALATTTPSGTVSVAWTSGATVAVSHLPSIPVGTATIGVVTANANLLTGTNYVGLASVNIGGTLPALTVGSATIGIVTANTNLLAGTAFIGLATVVNGAGTAQMGSVTVSSIGSGTAQVGSVTISHVVNSIVTVAPRTDYIGLVSVSGSVVNLAGTSQMGSVTVSNTINALATTTSTFLSSNYTSFATVISATGAATIFTVPNGQRFVLKDLVITSMGKSEVQISTHTTPIIPYTSLATQGGYVYNAGDSGLRGNVSGAFVVSLNGAATVGVSANVRFEA